MELNLYRTFPDELEVEWDALLQESVSNVPFMMYGYLRRWWQTLGGGEWKTAELALVVARRAGKLVGAAPLFFAEYQGKPALLLVGSIEVSDYQDFLVRPADLDEFLDHLLPFLAAELPGWKTIELYNVLDSSPSLPALQAAAERVGWSYRIESYKHCPFIELPGDWETYLAGIDKKQRHEIRRKMRRMEESDASAHWYVVENSATLDVEIENFLELMHQDDEKREFLTPAMMEHMRLTARWAHQAGILQMVFLEVYGQKAAGKFSFDYLGRLWGYNSGVDRRFMEYSPGWVLLGYMLKWAIEHGRLVLDFMRGDEQYKYRFGATDRFVMHATLER
jgi:CelD/BcsL family acetyltransferase involved in cellulose biosynthesis